MADPFEIERKTSEIEAKLANLDHHRAQFLDELTQLRQQLLHKKDIQSPRYDAGLFVPVEGR